MRQRVTVVDAAFDAAGPALGKRCGWVIFLSCNPPPFEGVRRSFFYRHEKFSWHFEPMPLTVKITGVISQLSAAQVLLLIAELEAALRIVRREPLRRLRQKSLGRPDLARN